MITMRIYINYSETIDYRANVECECVFLTPSNFSKYLREFFMFIKVVADSAIKI